MGLKKPLSIKDQIKKLETHGMAIPDYALAENMQVMKGMQREHNYYKDSLIVQHHKNKYGNKMPLWAIVELSSFSNLSKLYNATYISEQDSIAKNVGISRQTLSNHLHCLSVIKHHNRGYILFFPF